MSLSQINVNDNLVTSVDETPIAGSENLIKSKGVEKTINLNQTNVNSFLDIRNKLEYTFHYRYKAINATTGVVFSMSSNYTITDFIPVFSGDVLKYKLVAPSECATIAFFDFPSFYDFNRTLIVGNGNFQDNFIKFQEDGYIIACCHYGNLKEALLEFYNREGLYTDLYNKDLKISSIHREILNPKDAFSNFGRLEQEYNYRPVTRLAGTGYTNYRNTGFIKVMSGDILHYKLDAPNQNAGIVYFSDLDYDSSNSVLVYGTNSFVEGILNFDNSGYIIAVCNVLSLEYIEFYFENTIEGRLREASNAFNIIDTSINEINTNISVKVNKPSVSGEVGQVLTSKGGVITEWTYPGYPTDEQIQNCVNSWLESHPEATTTVEDRSISSSKIASGSFIAGGLENSIQDWEERATKSYNSHVEGYRNRSYEWHGHSEGSVCFVDGKISHAEGNACICSANDSHAEGNRTVTGRRYFTNGIYTQFLNKGSEDAGDNLGILEYVIIPDWYGDVTSYFPNKLTDNIEERYGTGSQKDSQGNIYKTGFIPAIWDGDEVVTENDLEWAMHPYCIIRGEGESSIEYYKIAKSFYITGIGTKVYFSYYKRPVWENVRGVYGSYCPVLMGGGNGCHSEGYITSACGYGAHSEGNSTRAWGNSSHAEGCYTYSDNYYSHAQGYHTYAIGMASCSEGAGSIAFRDYQKSYSAQPATDEIGKRQTCEIIYDNTYSNRGWHILPLINDVEIDKTYYIESTIIGKQISGTAETIGNQFVYKSKYCVYVDNNSNFVFLNNAIVELIGRSNNMDGDGITSGIRVTPYDQKYLNDMIILARFDSIENVVFRIMIHSKWEEFSV